MIVWTEIDIRTACDDVRKGVKIRKAAKKYLIPYTTLHGRINSTLPHVVAHQDQQKLSMPQEDLLADWVLFQESLGAPPTHTQIRELAQRISIECREGQKIKKR